MIELASRKVVAIGEAMVEMAPSGDGLYQQRYAGDTFNTAWHMAQLLKGSATVGFVTRIGTDSFSDRFAAEMASDSLDLSGVFRDEERQMGLYVIELKGFERSFHYWRKDSAARRVANDPAILRQAFTAAGLIHVSGITLAIISQDARARLMEALTEARQNNATISFDPNIRPRLWSSQDEAKRAVQEMMAITDIALPSFDDEAALWGDQSPMDTVRRFKSYGVPEIVVKNGAGPVTFTANGEVLTLATPPVTDILDTTGAGDGFNAGYLACRLLESRQAQAVAFGQELSSKIIATLGARADRERVRDMGRAIQFPSQKCSR